MDEFLQGVVLGVGTGAVDGLLAMGIVLIYRTTGVLNFAQAATGTLAAYVIYSVSLGHPLWLALAAGLGAGALTGAVTDRLVGSVGGERKALNAAVATLAVAILIQQIIRLGWGSTVGNFPFPFGFDAFQVGSVTIPHILAATAAVAAALALAIGAALRYTRIGTMIRALADNRAAAQLCGGNVAVLIAGVWAVAGALAALAGFFAPQTGAAFESSLLDVYFVGALVAAVLGGLRSLTWAFLGALALEVARTLFFQYAPGSISNYTQPFLIAVLIVILVLAPRRWLAPAGQRAV
jgi:branched-chain amino acid transport system permease protein